MTFKRKLLIVGMITLAGIVLLSLQPAIPQDPAFHGFADDRDTCGMPNGWNVWSNIPFLVVGVWGLVMIARLPMNGAVRRGYGVLFAGIVLTGLGSAYYHWAPDNDTLVYDRIPMTIVFMSFLSVVVLEWVHRKAGAKLLVPLVLSGIASVLWWHYTESVGQGDLRFYIFIQFYPMVIIPVIFLLFRPTDKNQHLHLLIGAVGWYIIAKLLEHYDGAVYHQLHFVSGHSLKHLAAAVSTVYILLFVKARYPLSESVRSSH